MPTGHSFLFCFLRDFTPTDTNLLVFISILNCQLQTMLHIPNISLLWLPIFSLSLFFAVTVRFSCCFLLPSLQEKERIKRERLGGATIDTQRALIFPSTFLAVPSICPNVIHVVWAFFLPHLKLLNVPGKVSSWFFLVPVCFHFVFSNDILF